MSADGGDGGVSGAASEVTMTEHQAGTTPDGPKVAQLLVEDIARREDKSERSLMHRYNNGAVGTSAPTLDHTAPHF